MTQIRALIEEKDRIERELQSNYAYLDDQPCGRKESLLDAEGFPRADCEAYSVTQARQNVETLRNDLKAVMECIHSALQE